MPIRLGNKAEGEDFFDRERGRGDLWRRLDGNHRVPSGPRRLGKTSPLQSPGRNPAPSDLTFTLRTRGRSHGR